MKGWRTPSLAKRAAAGSLLSLLLLTGLLLAAILAVTPKGDLAVEHAASVLGDGLVRRADGSLALAPGAEILELAERSPGLWFLAADGGRELAYGSPPEDARRIFPVFARSLRWPDDDVNLRMGEDGKGGHAAISAAVTDFGHAAVMVGGVDPKAVGSGDLLLYIAASAVFLLPPVMVATGMVLGLVVAPLILGGVRPLSRAAAALDGRDLARRLPERGVVSELLPLVRALNGALDRLEAAFEGRRRFMADVAHEFRTPLSVLTLHAEALPEGGPKADLQRGLFRMSQMVGQMLDSERLGRPDNRQEPMDLAAAAREAAAETAPLALDAGYELEFSAERETVTVTGDAHAVRRAAVNLLANAVAHGGGRGVIRVRVTADGVVEVEDEGAGVPEDARERVFEPFHRERWDKDGCGLGLHLVQEIMRAHGGRAEAGAGARGAVFRLVFPEPGAGDRRRA